MSEDSKTYKYITSLLENGEIKTCDIENYYSKYIDNRLPDELIALYKKMGNNLNEFKLGRWNIMSVFEANAYNTELYKYGETTIYNFAMVYHGMGWIIMAAIDLTNGMVFLRMDGGSNGYDVKHNFEKTLAYRKNCNKFKKKLMTFKEFIDKCILEEKSSYKDLISESIYIH